MKKITLISALLALFQFSASAQDTLYFNFTGGPATFTIPGCVSGDIEINAAGAGGGTSGYHTGGQGAVVTGNLPVSPGDVLTITIGGLGPCPGSGYNGGGAGFAAPGAPLYSSCGGGGSTNINVNGTPVVIAGAGGGAGGGGNSTFQGAGGNGGCPNGTQGQNSYGQGGTGGTLVGPGLGGAPWAGVPPGGSPGVGSTGGMGGQWNNASGGGGGGGFFGGGGGGNDGCCTGANSGSGGGGGSSLIPAGFGCTGGSNPGNGFVMIVIPECETTVCSGDTAFVDFAPQFPVGATNFTVTPPLGVYQAAPGDAMVGFHPVDTTVYTITAMLGGVPQNITWPVNAVDPIIPDAGLDDSTCFVVGTGYTLNGAIAQLPYNSVYHWELGPITTFTGGFGNGTFSPNNLSLNSIANVNQAGIYQFVLVEEDTNGVCADGRDTVSIYFSKETHTLAGTDPTCFGYTDGTVTITSDTSPASGNLGAIEYSNDGGVTWQSSNVFTGLPAGTYGFMSRDVIGCTYTTPLVDEITLVDPPEIIASFVTTDTLICINGTATLLATAINAPSGIYTYTWGPSNSTTSQNVVTPSPAGTDMTVSVYATSDIGCVSDTIYQDITHRAPITVTISDNDSICPGYLSTPHLNTVSGGYLNGIPNYTYTWTQNGSPYVSTNDSLFVNPTSNTTYCITANDGCETTPETACSEVVMRRVPNPVFTSDEVEGCVPTTITFDNLTNPIDSDSIVWTLRGNTYSNIDPLVFTFDIVGFYDVQLEVFSEFGCHDLINAQNYIHIHPNPDPEMFINPNPTTIYETEVKFNHLTTGTNTYAWFMPGASPSSSTDEAVTVFYPEGIAADYPVTLAVTDEWGCTTEIHDVVHIVNDILIYAPSIFTPDGDEYNESWKVHIDGIDIYDFHLTMYNRWGEMVWESYDPSAEWRGSYGENGIMDGTFVWFIECKANITDKKYEFRGHVTVLK